MSDDLVKRLRQTYWNGPPSYVNSTINPAGPEAADRIEALSARLAEVEAERDRLQAHLDDVEAWLSVDLAALSPTDAQEGRG